MPRRSRLTTHPAVEALIVANAAAVIDVGREREEREILPIHVVFQVENPRETGAGNFRFIPGAVARAASKANNAVPRCTLGRSEIAAGAQTHQRPRGLRGRARAFAFQVGIFVGGATFAPAAIIVLAALEPIASAQNPLLGHVFADCAQTARAPARCHKCSSRPSVRTTSRRLPGSGANNGLLSGRSGRPGLITDVAEQFQGARGQIAAGGIENRHCDPQTACLRANRESHPCRTPPSRRRDIGNSAARRGRARKSSRVRIVR